MNNRNLGWPVNFLGVTNLANRLKLLQFSFIRRIGDSGDRRCWPLWPLGYEKCSRNLLQDKENYGILFGTMTRLLGD